MILSRGGDGDGWITIGVGVGVCTSCCGDASRSLITSTVRNKGYSLRLLIKNDAKSSGFSFNEIYLSASGWTNVPWSENNFRIDFIANPIKIFSMMCIVNGVFSVMVSLISSMVNLVGIPCIESINRMKSYGVCYDPAI